MPAVHSFLKSFVYAGRGLAIVLRTERNARIDAVIAIGVVVAGGVLRIERWEWCAVIGAIGLVTAAETANTSIERLLDRLHPDQDPEVGAVKDLAAGAVLLAAMGAAAIGVVVFGPRLLAAVSGAG